MAEYVERRAVLDIATEWCPDDDGSVGKTGDLRDMLDELEAIPAADVAEVRHGANIGEDYAACDQFVCDQCGVELQGWYRVERDMDDGEETHHEYVMRYCPNCGVKIDGGVNDG